MIEALKDIDELTFDSDLSDKDQGLEEGEMLPPVIEDWKSDDEVLPDEDEDINEHIVSNQSKTEVVFEEDMDVNVVDLAEVKSTLNEEGQDTGEINETELTKESLRSAWFKRLLEKQVLQYKSNVNISGTKELSQWIISWFFDSELKVFVIKRDHVTWEMILMLL